MRLIHIPFSGQEDIYALANNDIVLQIINRQKRYEVYEVEVSAGESLKRYIFNVVMEDDELRIKHPEYFL